MTDANPHSDRALFTPWVARSIYILLTIFLALLPSGTAVVAARANASPVCGDFDGIVKSVLRDINLKNIVVQSSPAPIPMVLEIKIDGGYENVPLSPISDKWYAGWDGQKPSKDLVNAWFIANKEHDSFCFTRLDISGITLKSQIESDAYYKRFYGSRGGGSIYKFSRPAIIGNSALIYLLKSGNSKGQFEKIILLRKKDNSWNVIGGRVISVS